MSQTNPTLLEKHGEALIALCSEGLSLRDASTHRGIAYKTVQAWITQGRRSKTGPCREFAAALDAARATIPDEKPNREVWEATQNHFTGLQLGPEHELAKAQALTLAAAIDDLKRTKGGAAAQGLAKLSERLEQIIETIPSPREPDAVDQIAERMRRRKAGLPPDPELEREHIENMARVQRVNEARRRGMQR